MILQKLWFAEDGYEKMENCLSELKVKCLLLVHGERSYEKLGFREAFDDITKRNGIRVVHFTDFKPNPDVSSVVEGVKRFQKEKPDFLMAVGGGSAIDVAKCVKLYAKADTDENLLAQKDCCVDIPFAVMPTTAGTGSEATRFAVIYENGEKQSVTSEYFIPNMVLFAPATLGFLPMKQRKATFLDALSHAVESYWSVNANEESRAYAGEAIRLLMANTGYIETQEKFGRHDLLQYAAYLAGKAINISQTTAGHAMCYKLTSLFGLPHGQATFLCVVRLWRYMQSVESMQTVLREIAGCMGYEKSEAAVSEMEDMLRRWKIIEKLKSEADEDYEQVLHQLVTSVNQTRLKNHPVTLPDEILQDLYRKILAGVF